MDLKTLQSIVAAGESEIVEFKKTTGDLPGACQSLCGMLNAGLNGSIFIGVAGGKITGQTVSDRTQQEIAQALKEFTPDAEIKFSLLQLDEKRSVVILQALSKAARIPYFFRGKAYLRVGPTTSLISRDRLQSLFIEKHRETNFFDRQEATDSSLADIDFEWVLRAVELGIAASRLPPSVRESPEIVLEKFKLLRNGHVTNAAIILFGKTSQVPIQCKIMLARFKGREKGEFLDNKQCIGNAFEILDAGMMFLSRHLPVRGKFEKNQLQRIDEPLIPTDALREALVNAICHRDYENPGSSIHLAIYDDRVEIINTGGLMPGIHITDLNKPHTSILRNPTIAQIFFHTRYVEQWGQGTLKIAKLCKEAGLAEPTFLEHPLWFGICFKANVLPDLINDISSRQKKILDLLFSHKNLSVKNLHLLLPFIGQRMLQRDLHSLQQENLVKTSGKGPSTTWEIILKS